MKIAIPKEIREGETRVAVVPGMINLLKQNDHEILLEQGAGEAATFQDEAYRNAGATIITDPVELLGAAEVVLKVQPPQINPELNKHEIDLIPEGTTLISFLAPLDNRALLLKLAERRITSFALEFIPRITRAQSMDALSSMATIAGYKAVLIAADHLKKIFPLLMTAAGTIPPANVFVLGAGVAGLQAIATAKRLGARVEAFDPRPAVKEQVESLGAQFVEMELPEDAETASGYAKLLPEEFIKKEQAAIANCLPRIDVAITTAQVFGQRAPLLITEEMVALMRPGSVIIDLAAEQGGNCALTQANQIVEKNGVQVFGMVNLPAALPTHASQMYSKNITNLFRHLFPTAERQFDFNDEITKSACLTHQGEIVNQIVKEAFARGDKSNE